ncbi:MAG: T9SS type A sorting domain-containing protein [Candidatus Marinimicrobia bacterium]|nr:T9SS type A sorting domain-containing protein [Candidatus Neomarinimicrobiota bacterium]
MASTNVFPQLGDIGDSFDSFSRPTVRDSMNYYIYEGESPLFYIPMEGGALDLIGQSVESISFSIYNDGKKIALKEGMIFEGQNENQIISTFLFSLDGDEKKIHYKIISYNSIDIENIILFKKDSENINHLARPMIPQSGTVPKPVVISREDWGADPPDGQYSNHPYYDKLTLHHAACCSAENIEEGLEQVKWIQYFHQNGRGWMDIGYHFLVDRAGNIYQGRPETVLGAHVGGANTGNIGVCLLGCYHPPEDNCYQTMTDESRDALVKLYGWISDTYGQDPGALLGHRDYFGTTACPGNNVWNEIMIMRFEINDYIESTLGPSISFQGSPYPNPFSDLVSLRFHTTENSNIQVDIFDLLGRNISSISGYGSDEVIVQWNGKNNKGKLLSSGIYLAKPVGVETKNPLKLIYLRGE